MKYLVDTHIIIWSLNGSDKLSREALDIMGSKTDTFYYSMASVWEVGIKHDLYASDINISASQFSDFCDKAGYRLLNISVAHIEAVSTLKRVADHRDPFDRLLLAQAKQEGMKLISHDNRLSAYGESCLIYVP